MNQELIRSSEKDIPPKRRELMFRVMDGHYDLSPLVYQIYCHIQCDDILRWLLASRLTGQELRKWFQIECGGSFVFMLTSVVKRLRADLERKPMIVGKDYITR